MFVSIAARGSTPCRALLPLPPPHFVMAVSLNFRKNFLKQCFLKKNKQIAAPFFLVYSLRLKISFFWMFWHPKDIGWDQCVCFVRGFFGFHLILREKN